MALVSGFTMGRVDRHMGLASGDKLFESILEGVEDIPAIYRYMGNMRKIIEQADVRYWRMAPNDDLLVNSPEAVFCLAEPGREYLVYFAFGGDAGIELPAGKYTASWYDPRTGVLKETKVVDGGEANFASPDDEDWVLHVSEER